MKRQQAVIRLPAVLSIGGLLLLAVGLFVARGTTGTATTLSAPGLAMPGNEALTTTPTVDPNDKFAGDNERATQVAAIPSATRYWPYPTPTRLFTPTDWPPAVPYQPAGAGYILTGGYLGMSSGDFKDTNGWLELLPDRVIRVFAGGDGYIGDPTQGLLVISVMTPAPDRVQIGNIEEYRTPSKAGPVTITDAVGERLTLQADDGTRFTFDVASRQWGQP